jgi:hypothetical protein
LTVLPFSATLVLFQAEKEGLMDEYIKINIEISQNIVFLIAGRLFELAERNKNRGREWLSLLGSCSSIIMDQNPTKKAPTVADLFSKPEKTPPAAGPSVEAEIAKNHKKRTRKTKPVKTKPAGKAPAQRKTGEAKNDRQ